MNKWKDEEDKLDLRYMYITTFIIFIVTVIFTDSFILWVVAWLSLGIASFGLKGLRLIITLYFISYFYIPPSIFWMNYNELNETYNVLGEMIKERKENKKSN